tara:strand:- start:98 stop:310 length:213 start_codon:yes stop_codon:yes gene_type:complete
MSKYKNKDGIELNFGGMSEEGIKGSGGELIQEVVKEAITILSTYNRDSTMSTNMAIGNTIDFLKENFDIK